MNLNQIELQTALLFIKNIVIKCRYLGNNARVKVLRTGTQASK